MTHLLMKISVIEIYKSSKEKKITWNSVNFFSLQL